MVQKISRKMIFFLIKSRKATDCVRGVRQFIVPVARREGETYRASFRTGPWNPSGDSTIDGGWQAPFEGAGLAPGRGRETACPCGERQYPGGLQYFLIINGLSLHPILSCRFKKGIHITSWILLILPVATMSPSIWSRTSS